MTLKNRILVLTLGWVTLISALHGYLNINWADILNDQLPENKRRLNVAYIPVT